MRQNVLVTFFVIFLVCSVYIFLKTPNNQRNWEVGFDILPAIHIDSTDITISNVRNFRHISDDSFIVNYYNQTFDLDKLESLWFVL